MNLEFMTMTMTTISFTDWSAGLLFILSAPVFALCAAATFFKGMKKKALQLLLLSIFAFVLASAFTHHKYTQLTDRLDRIEDLLSPPPEEAP